MAILFGLGFFCLSLLFSLFERRSNIIVALTSFGILMIIFCFSYHNADYIVYEDLYHALKKTTNYSLEALDIFPLVGYLRTDYGYVFITKVFYDLGFSYFDYRVITIGVFFVVIFLISKRIVDFPIFVLLLYFIYPVFVDVVQIRNWYVEIFLLAGIYWMASGEKYRNLVFVLFIILAATIHVAALVYLPFVLFLYIREYKYGNALLSIMCCVGILSPLWANLISAQVPFFLDLAISSNIGGMNYLTDPIGVRHFVAYVAVMVMCGTMYFIKKQYEKGVLSLDNIKKRYIYLVYDISVYFLVLSPLYSLSKELGRVPRNAVLLFYIALAIYITNIKSNHTKTVIVVLSVIFAAAYGYVDFYMSVGSAEVHKILQNNIVFDFFYENFGI